MVFYDGCFAKEFKNMSAIKVLDIMAIVQEIFSEFEYLGTTIEFQDDFPIIPHLQSRWCEKNWTDILSPSGELSIIANGSKFDANAFVFLTNGSQNGLLGMAYLGQACNIKKSFRISISTYSAYSWKNGDLNTAHVMT